MDVRGIKQFDNTMYGSVIYDLKGEDLARKQEIGTAKFSLSVDKNWEKSYNLYTATDDFVRQVPSSMRHDFTRSLANKTSGMTEGETRTVYIYAGNVYAFRADGYMHGEVEEVFTPSEFKDIIATRKEYKNAIDADTKTADLWSKPISDTGRGSRSDISVLEGRGRPAPNDILSEDSSERYTARYTERERQNFETKEEIDTIVKKLREMFGFDAKESNGTFEENQVNDIAPVKASSTDDVFFDGETTKFSLSSDSEGRKLTEAQRDYFKDSKVVDENGSLKVMYHGTPNGDFTVFKDGTYFTESKWYADLYQNPGASSISAGKVASNPKTFEVYLDIKKPFDINDPKARSIYINDYIKGGNAVGINPYLSDAEYNKIETIDWAEGEDLRDFLIFSLSQPIKHELICFPFF